MAKSSLERTLTALRKLTEFDPDMTMQQFRVLVEVAVASDSPTSRAIADRMGVAQPTVSRALDLWGAYGTGDKTPRKFCERVEDPEDRRLKPVKITPAGRRFLEEVLHARR